MPPNPPISMAPSAARTTSGNGDWMDLSGWIDANGGDPPQLRVQSDVTAASGTTPSLTITIEDSIDGTNPNTIITFTAQTAVNRAIQTSGIRGDAYPAGFAWPFNWKKVRARWTITGTTPSFTFSVKAAIL